MTRRLLPLALAVAVAGYLLSDQLVRVPPPAVPPADDGPADPADARRAFAGPPAGGGDAGMAELFAALGEAGRRRDPGLTDRFDFARLFAAVRQADVAGGGGLPADPADPSARLLDAVWAAVKGGWLGAGWDRTVIRRVDPEPGGAVVWARHGGGGGWVPARWRLTRTAGEWRVADVEDVRVGVRLSHQLAALAAAPLPGAEAAAVAAGLEALSAAGAALAGRDPAAADAALGPARAAPLPPPHRLTRCLTEAAVALGLGRPDDALRRADEADTVRPNTPAADLVRAAAHYRQRRWAKAATAARRVVTAVGPDPQASLVLGLSLAELGRPAEAVAELRAAAAEFPDAAELQAAVSKLTGEGVR